MMKFLSTMNFALLMAGTPDTVTTFVVPPGEALTTQVHSYTGLPCEGYLCNKTFDIYYPPKTFIQNLGNRDTSLAVRESSLAVRNTSLAIRDTSLALRDPPQISAYSTTTTTVTTSVVTLTMSCWDPSFTPVDGTTYHCSTTIPPPVSNFNSISGTGSISGVTIMSNGTTAATITSPRSTFSVMPPPSITSVRPFVTASNASTTIITPATEVSDTMSLTVTINLTAVSYATASIGNVPTVTLTSLTTVDSSSDTSTLTSETSADSSGTTSASRTDAPQSAGKDVKIGHNKLAVALIAGLVVNGILAAIL